MDEEKKKLFKKALSKKKGVFLKKKISRDSGFSNSDINVRQQ